MLKKSFLFFILIIIASCTSLTKEEKKYIQEIDEWHKKRIDRLKEKDSWLSLAGLFWLEEGVNSFGSDKSNDIVFPEGKAADFMGWFDLKDSVVRIRLKPGINITNEDKPIIEMILQNDNTKNPSILKY